ncbi:Fanconi anemia group B protein [Hoplias malabaricus]|uniref:Fanconi anemia group B protein n=1 Tax=Hoplias malabaricus TaxID=27720 RepID=UPI003461BDD6
MVPGQQVRVLSICGRLLVIQHKHTSPKGSNVLYWNMLFSQELCGFINKDGNIGSVYKNASREVDIVCCALVLDVKTRQKVPCILLRLLKKMTYKYLLYSLDASKSARLHIELSLPYELCSDISILQGPTLVWSHEDKVFYTSSEVGGVKEVPISLSVNIVGELPLRQRRIGVLGSKLEDKTRTNFVLHLLEDGRNFAGTCLIPEAYSSVIRTLVVISTEETNGSLRSTVLAATSKKQLVRFENGLPEDVCILPYEGPQSIRTVHVGNGGCIIAIVFDHGNVCVVWNDGFKVAGCWTGVRSLLVDDFLGCGSEQILLIFEDPDEEVLGRFLLTDLCGVHYSCGGPESEDRRDVAPENTLQTVKALDSRLQSGVVFLQQIQRELSVKERVLQRSVTALTDLAANTEHIPPPPQQEGLVCLWDEESEEDEAMEMEPGERSPEVLKLWQRVFGEKLVFGVLLSANTHSSETVTGFVLLEPSGAVVQSSCKTLPYPVLHSSSDLEPPASKRRAPPGGSKDFRPPQTAVMIATDLAPLLTSSRISCSILLHLPASKPGPTVHQCGQVSVDVKDVLQGALQPHLLTDCTVISEDSAEDILSMLAALDSWLFSVESVDHTLVDVPRWTKDRFSAESVGVIPQVLLIKNTHPSSPMVLHWEPSGPFQALLRVHCRGQLAVLHFLDSLCDFLPASHHIRSLCSSTPRGCGRSSARLLEKELWVVKEGVASLLHVRQEDEGQPSTASRESASPEKLRLFREEWHRERKKSSRILCPLVDVSQYRSLLGTLIETQLEGDIAALLETWGHDARNIVD